MLIVQLLLRIQSIKVWKLFSSYLPAYMFSSSGIVSQQLIHLIDDVYRFNDKLSAFDHQYLP